MLDDRNVSFLGLETGFLGRNDPFRDRNAKPFRDGAAAYSGNVFYYWFHFLKLHREFVGVPANSPSASVPSEVQSEFDVEPYDEFLVWWNAKGRFIFGGNSEDSPRAESSLSPEEFLQKRDGVAVFFPFDGDIETMFTQAEQQFRKARAAFYAQDPTRKPSRELHKRRYEIVSLHNKLIIYRAVMSAPKEKTLVEIFDSIVRELDLSTMRKRRRSADNPVLDQAVSASSLTPDRITKWMAENFDQACRLVYHVAHGEFPKFQKPQAMYNPRRDAIAVG